MDTTKTMFQVSKVMLFNFITYNKMSYKKKKSSDDNELAFEVQILKVKLEQYEKRLDMIEKAFSMMEHAHRLEMLSLLKNHNNSSNDDTSTEASYDTTSETTSETSNKYIETASKKDLHKPKSSSATQYLRRVG